MNERQHNIFKYVKQTRGVSISEILNFFDYQITRITALRDLDKLIELGKVERMGQGRATLYKATAISDIDEYFNTDPDKRVLKSEYYNFNAWAKIKDIFSLAELLELVKTNNKYLYNRANLSDTGLKKELERLTIEFSWKSSQIEGNTYTLLDTERLLTTAEEAVGKKREESTMILNHKKALDFVFADPSYFNSLTVSKIESLHRLIVEGLDVGFGIRNHRVGITGTAYRPLDNSFQICDEVEKLVKTINKTKNPFNKAFLAVLMISYIQPFEDGNKRTARLLGNALLLAGDYCPLSYRSVNETEYKKAAILFYEQNDWRFFKRMFIEQFKQAVAKYF